MIEITNTAYLSARLLIDVKTKIDLDVLQGYGTLRNVGVINRNGAYIMQSTAAVGISTHHQNNGYKLGAVKADKTITWSVCFNELFQDMENPVLMDYLPLDQKLLYDTDGKPWVRVYDVTTSKGGGSAQMQLNYSIGANPITTSPKLGDWTSYNVDYYPLTGELKVQFNGKATSPYIVQFDVERVTEKDTPYTNTAQVISDNGPKSELLSASVTVADSASYATKSGVMGTDSNINWEVIIDKTGYPLDTVWTDENGIATLTVNKSGIYYLEEFQAPSGYLIEASSANIIVEFTDAEKDLSLTVTNKFKITDFEFVKEDASNTAAWTLVDTVISGSDGKILFAEFKNGLYLLVETESPFGYELQDDAWLVTVNADDEIVYLKAKGNPPELVANE